MQPIILYANLKKIVKPQFSSNREKRNVVKYTLSKIFYLMRH